MRRTIITLMLPVLFLGTAVWAQEETTGVTVREAEEVKTVIQDEMLGLKPQVGALVYKDRLGSDTSRMVYGLTADLNVMRWIDKDRKDWYVGPSTGFIYSHLGAPDSNFFGTDPSGSRSGGSSNLFYIPLNAKIGYNFGEDFRLALHGGGNLLYRSVANSMSLGDTSLTSDTNTTVFPNVGADFEFGLGANTALMLRPDLTITPGDEFFTGTLALSIALT